MNAATNAYRTHHCAALRKSDIGQTVKLSGWIHRKRDHGGVLFIDLRDTNGFTQCVIDQDSPLLSTVDKWRVESVITVQGRVKARHEGTQNARMATGDIEVYIDDATLQSAADVLPLQVAEADGAGEDVRLKYRFLDLRREGMHSRIRLRNNVIASIRRRMWDQGFQEFQTPELTASSPEGARDFLVPSRLHPGKFYALPQSPQQFKQLLMVAGFDRYFQIAPCFRDEDARADRLPVHYQLDVEMSFVEQQDVFNTMSPVVGGIFEEFSAWTGTPHTVEWLPNLTYTEAMLTYGSDKPDLRNPLVICDVTDIFKRNDVTFNAFKGAIEKGAVVRAIRAPDVSTLPRSFFDRLNDWAKGEGAPGLGYITFDKAGFQKVVGDFSGNSDMLWPPEQDGTKDYDVTDVFKGPIAKFLSLDALRELRAITQMQPGDSLFLLCDKPEKAAKMAGRARDKICDDLPEGHACRREKGVYKLFWIVDFPMYEADEKTGRIDFSHNPFSMPQGGLESLETKNPLDILANQYDLVCNGYEMSSGGIRNHRPDVMEKAFAIAGYPKDVLEAKFGGMLNAFRFGAPPHGGCGIGVDRIVMLLANEPNLREINAFTMNGAYEDPLMGAPSEASAEQLRDLHLKVVMPVKAVDEKKRA